MNRIDPSGLSWECPYNEYFGDKICFETDDLGTPADPACECFAYGGDPITDAYHEYACGCVADGDNHTANAVATNAGAGSASATADCGGPCPKEHHGLVGTVYHAVSDSVQMVDVLPFPSLAGIPGIVVDVVAFGFAETDVLIAGLSGCSFDRVLEASLINGANGVVGVTGNIVSVVTTPALPISIGVAVATSVAEGGLYYASSQVLEGC